MQNFIIIFRPILISNLIQQLQLHIIDNILPHPIHNDNILNIQLLTNL